MKKSIPIYDICKIDKTVHPDLLIERLASYIHKHYHNLSKPHRHTFYHLVLFTKGSGTHTIDFHQYTIKPYQIYFMAPGQVHSWHFNNNTDGYIIHFNAELFSTFLQRSDYINQFPFFKGYGTDNVFNIPTAYHDKIRQISESLIKEMEEGAHSFDLIRVLLLELFISIERCCVNTKTKKFPPQKLTVLNNFKQLVEKHFRTLRLPKEYADLLYITPNHLNALCQEVAGQTAGELIRDRIMLEAKRLLTNADMDINEIAYDLNFNDNSYFTRFFKKNSGITPEQFRKQVK